MRLVALILGDTSAFSKDIVYNNFPWPGPTDAQKARIEQAAQATLEAYGFPNDADEADIVARLFKLCRELTTIRRPAADRRGPSTCIP